MLQNTVTWSAYIVHILFFRIRLWTGAQLNVDTHKKLINEIKKDGLNHCKYIRYTSNGEPLIHKILLRWCNIQIKLFLQYQLTLHEW